MSASACTPCLAGYNFGSTRACVSSRWGRNTSGAREIVMVCSSHVTVTTLPEVTSPGLHYRRPPGPRLRERWHAGHHHAEYIGTGQINGCTSNVTLVQPQALSFSYLHAVALNFMPVWHHTPSPSFRAAGKHLWSRSTFQRDTRRRRRSLTRLRIAEKRGKERER